MANPIVTVIIPTYNRAHLIGRSITSVLGQTYQDFELIVIDDGSTDNTEEIARRFSDKRLRYIRRNKNSGTPAIPTNEGIRTATGKYIAIQDSDDEWLPTKLEKQMNVFKSAPPKVGVVYTDMWRITENGKKEYWHSPKIMPEDGIIYKDALGFRVERIGTVTLLLRKECFDKVGLFDVKLPMYIDTEFLIRLSKYYYFYHLQEPLANYFATSGSIALDVKSKAIARELILEKYFADIKNDRKLLARHYFAIGNLLCADADIRQGRNYIVKAILSYPLNAKHVLAALISLLGQRSYSTVTDINERIQRWGSRNG